MQWPILLKFLPEALIKREKQYFNNLSKIQTLRKCTRNFSPTLTPRFPLKMAEIEKNMIISTEKRQSSGYPNMSKPRPFLFSPLNENRITFCTFWAFWGKKQGGVKF